MPKKRKLPTCFFLSERYYNLSPFGGIKGKHDLFCPPYYVDHAIILPEIQLSIIFSTNKLLSHSFVKLVSYTYSLSQTTVHIINFRDTIHLRQLAPQHCRESELNVVNVTMPACCWASGVELHQLRNTVCEAPWHKKSSDVCI